MALKRCKNCNNEFNAVGNSKTCSVQCSSMFKKNRRSQYESNYRKHNRDMLLKKKQKYYQDNKVRLNQVKKEYNNKKHSEDISFKLKANLRTRLGQAIRNNQKSGSAIDDLGCSIEELKKHLELQFKEGMNWDNWTRDGWHIDHIKSLASFDLTDEEQFKQAVHYTNLQPMWAKDNLKKG